MPKHIVRAAATIIISLLAILGVACIALILSAAGISRMAVIILTIIAILIILAFTSSKILKTLVR